MAKVVGECPHCGEELTSTHYDRKAAVFVCPECGKWVNRSEVNPKLEEGDDGVEERG